MLTLVQSYQLGQDLYCYILLYFIKERPAIQIVYYSPGCQNKQKLADTKAVLSSGNHESGVEMNKDEKIRSTN